MHKCKSRLNGWENEIIKLLSNVKFSDVLSVTVQLPPDDLMCCIFSVCVFCVFVHNNRRNMNTSWVPHQWFKHITDIYSAHLNLKLQTAKPSMSLKSKAAFYWTSQWNDWYSSRHTFRKHLTAAEIFKEWKLAIDLAFSFSCSSWEPFAQLLIQLWPPAVRYRAPVLLSGEALSLHAPAPSMELLIFWWRV